MTFTNLVRPLARISAAGVLAATVLGLTFSATPLRAQSSRAQIAQQTLHISVGADDQVAATMTADYHVHILPSKLHSSNTSRSSHAIATSDTSEGAISTSAPATADDLNRELSTEVIPKALTIPSLPSPGFYPSDVSNPSHGTVVTSAKSDPIYVNCAATCWGTPTNFLTNLDASTLIHVSDQYTGLITTGRYTVGASASITYPVYTMLSDNDMLQIVHSAAKSIGVGYTHIYHIFLPSGVDVCFTGTSECYSPDNPNTFYFCAYHGSVTFSDIGHVLFTVEPYQNVNGCSVAQPSPNGALIDSTSNVLGHETLETITDPDPPNAWVAQATGYVLGAEIGDLCETPTFSYKTVALNGKNYEVQPVYSNTYHGCAFVP